MKTHVAIFVVLIAAFGLIRAEETHHTQSVISFIETNSEGHRVRELAFDLTDQATKTCLGGTWKTARVVRDPGNYTRNPAYRLEKGSLEVLLINGPCDSYDSYVGELKGRTFKGDHVEYGMRFHKQLGTVTGEYAK